MKFPLSDIRFQISAPLGRRFRFPLSALRFCRAFSLVEVLLVISMLSLIVLALMAVFSSTQRAFRASVTQTDVLEGGRMTVELISADLRGLTPSYGASNIVPPNVYSPVNFFVVGNSTFYAPLVQSLPASTYPRTNLLNYFFVLGRENTKWTGTGYIVDTSSSNPLFPLYRFYAETNLTAHPEDLFYQFSNYIYNRQFTNMSHLVDGVVHLTVRAYDPAGRWINDNSFPSYTNAMNTYFLAPAYGEAQIYMFSNAVPAAVELELGILEDHAIARAGSLGIAGQPPANVPNQWNFLGRQSGSLHIFRQRVTVPNVDPSAYQ
jgi:type II secretory pathway pseudopilin PulG